MLSKDKLLEVFSQTFKIEICVKPRLTKNFIKKSIKELLIRHNEKYDTEIEDINISFFDEYEDTLEYNDCRILVGDEVVQCIKAPDLSGEFKSDDYYNSIISITEQILDLWHDKIIEIQDENLRKLESFIEDEYYEIVYAYYSLFQPEKNGFKYLKKLATRYPNSKYMERLIFIYRKGKNNWHRGNKKLYEKLTIRKDKYRF